MAHNCCCGCFLIWVILFIMTGFMLMLNLNYLCSDLLEFELHEMNTTPFIVYVLVHVFIGYVALGSLCFLILIKCQVTSTCWTCFKCLWLIGHFLLGIGTIAFVYVAVLALCWGGIHFRSFTECQGKLSPSFSQCYTNMLFYSLATLLFGLLPFVIFSIAYKRFRKMRMAELSSPRSARKPRKPAVATTSSTENEKNAVKEILAPRNNGKAEMISKLMNAENRLGRAKYGNRFVSDINAPIQAM